MTRSWLAGCASQCSSSRRAASRQPTFYEKLRIDTTMPIGERELRPGTLVAQYRIERRVGSGAMGIVYAARDTKLQRCVALKVLRESSAGDPARLRRFVREAQLASALNHPAIVTLFDSGSAAMADGDGAAFLAMELIEGSNLAEWAREVRDPARILRVLAAVAGGLARAHEAGVVHRDFKPANVMDGRGDLPQIVDFGVAKLTERAERSGNGDTAPSAVVGTPAYMAPEQVNGGVADARSDIFAFGCVAFELFAGSSPFLRKTPVETMHAVLHDVPPSLPADVPPGLERIVRRCLMRNPEERYQSIQDAALDLTEVLTTSVEPERRRRRVSRRYTLAAIAGVVVLLSVWGFARRTDLLRAPAHSALAQPVMERMTNSGNIVAGAISPDGNVLADVTADGDTQSLWVRQVATGTSVRIVPAQPVSYTNVTISGDGNYIYYGVATNAEPNVVDLMQVPLLGGEPRRVVHDYDDSFAVSPDGRSVVFRRFNAVDRIDRLFITDVNSGDERLLFARPFPNSFRAVAWRPDGKRVTFVGGVLEPKWKMTLYDVEVDTGSITVLARPPFAWISGLAWLPDGSGILVNAAHPEQAPQIWLLDPRDGETRKVTSDISEYGAISVTADGRSFVCTRSELSANIWVTSLKHPSTAQPVTTGLGNRFGGSGVRWMPDGRIAFTAVFPGSGPSLLVTSASGGTPQPFARGFSSWNPSVSPDGSRLAFVSDRSGVPEVWISSVDGSNAKQLTQSRWASWPVWTPDGQSLIYSSFGKLQAAWRVSVAGGAPVRLTEQPANSPRVSPDGHWLLCRLRSSDGKPPLWRTAVVPLDGKGPPRFLDLPRAEPNPSSEWLPDSSGFVYVDSLDGAGNLWSQSLRGGEPRKLTNFDSGRIGPFDVDRNGRIALARAERINDLVLVRDFH
jgi:serine/threonine protein kinase/Tol biopolymer transport system component